MMTITAYIGTYLNRAKEKSSYSVSLSLDGTLCRSFTKFEPANSTHRLVLLCVRDLCEAASASKSIGEPLLLFVYTSDRNVAFEWENEYKANTLANDTEDYDLWKDIIRITEDNQINLCVYRSKDRLVSRSGGVA